MCVPQVEETQGKRTKAPKCQRSDLSLIKHSRADAGECWQSFWPGNALAPFYGGGSRSGAENALNLATQENQSVARSED